ncbi:N-terminal acetyltransferase [Entomortierella lignicola]|nr:N-terminal acetyltransferase [Entomortierella lignicola]
MTMKATEHYSRDQIFDFLNHINFPLADPNVLPEPTLETLRELQYRCVTSIPFETLSLRTTKSRSVDTSLEGIYDRIINKRRGGWCFTLNKLGFELLRAIGYTAQFTLGRVCNQASDPIEYTGLTHRTSIVRFENGTKYVFEIGFGCTHYYPLELKEGATVEFFGHQRRMVKTVHNLAEPHLLGNPAQELWCMEEYQGNDKWVPCYVISEQQFFDIDCDVGNFYSCSSPNSILFKTFWCMQGTLDGTYYLLMGNELKVRTSTGTKEKIVFEKEQDRVDALEKYFGIILTEEELKYHDQKIE